MTNKKKVITTAAAAVILAFSTLYSSSLSGSLDSQNMADRWQAGDLRYSQISVFYPAGKKSYGITETESMRAGIEAKIKEGSFKPENEDAEIWTDAFCSVPSLSEVSVYNESTGKTESSGGTFSVTCIGGDFFEFHPLELVSGNYIYDNELRNDRVVLDEQSAWDIFCSTDVTGMKLIINGTEFEVAGVVRPEQNSAVKKCYPENPVIYVHYDVPEEAGTDTALLCYEAVLPNPVTNYAKNIILEKFGISTMTEPEDGRDPERSLDVVVQENTGRYRTGKLWNGLRRFDESVISDRSIAYPYWENAARVNGVKMEILFFISLLMSAYIFIIAASAAAKLWLNRKWHLKDYLEDMMYRYTYKKRISDYITSGYDEDNRDGETKYEQ